MHTTRILKFTFSEKLETIVDSFASLSSAFLNISDGIEPKYMYFSSVPTSYTPIWPSLVAVFVVLIFFVMGLILCCCGLFMFGLVEEGENGRGSLYRNLPLL